VAKVVAPKKAALAQAEGEYATQMEGLAAKKAELDAVVAALDALNTKLAAMQVGLRGRQALWWPCCLQEG
jgi:dynein heavy chain